MANNIGSGGATAAQAPPRTKLPAERIADRIPHLPNGDRAQLRRVYLTERHAADGIIIGLLHGAGITSVVQPEAYRPWRLFVHCAALLSGAGEKGEYPHSIGRKLGAALHDMGMSENRLLRLTSARGPTLDAQVIRAVRMLVQRKREAVNLLTLFDLVGNDPGQADAARRRIARDYYAAAAAAAK